MKKYLFFSFAALAAMVSCNQENGPVQGTEPEPEPSVGRREVTIVADASETKTVLTDENAVHWEKDDAVRLLFTPQDGTGLPVHTEVFTTATQGATATFTGSIPNDVKYASDGSAYSDALYMVYPSTAMDEDGTVSFSLDDEQTVAPGSFPSGLNLSSALVSFEALDNAGTVNATFLNAFAIIRFTLPADVKSLKITGTGNLAGDAVLEFDDDARLVADSFTSESKSVTLTPASGNAFAAGESYNILVYPGIHSKITVELIDTDDCTYSKTVEKAFDFQPAMYYTFNFNTQFGKDLNFTVSGMNISNYVRAVFADATETNEYLSAVTDNAFSVKLPHGFEPTSGYVVYPASFYSEGKINYYLDPIQDPQELFTAALPLDGGSVRFNPVTSALSKMKFTVPAGVSKVTLDSTVGFAGDAVMTVGTDGKMTAGAGNVTTLTCESVSGVITLNVYPFSDADITVTFEDAVGAVNVQKFSAQTVAAGDELTLAINQNIEFQKGGSFTGDNFTSGGETIQF